MTTFQVVIIVGAVIVAQGAVLFIVWRLIWPQMLHRLEKYAYHYSNTYPYYAAEYAPELMFIVERAERKAQVELTWGARQMLIIPVLETIQERGRVDWDEIDESVNDIIRTISEEERRPELGQSARDSISVIRGFWKRFCNIPPFCRRTEETRG